MSGTSDIPPPNDQALAWKNFKRKAQSSPARLRGDPTGESRRSLQALCRVVIVANIERYPPECFQILDEDSWDAIVRLRNDKTAPRKGHGGLDGSGRLVPSISDRVLSEIERASPHLADSFVADELVWSTCVEYRFKAGGLTRPRALMYPWPILVRKVQTAADGLVALIQSTDPMAANQIALDQRIRCLSESPMNVALLRATGAGRQVKTFVKFCSKPALASLALDVQTPRPLSGAQKRESNLESPLSRLKALLQMWKDLAAKSGVAMISNDQRSDDGNFSAVDEEDLRVAESCETWRALFLALSTREADRRASQGARMREIRKNLATGRPKIVKVRPASKRQQEILNRPMQKRPATLSKDSVRPSKLQKLRKKIAHIPPTSQRKPASFGAAVAFASVSKPNASRRKQRGTVVSLGGGKKMTLPPAYRRKDDTLKKLSTHTRNGRKSPR